MDEAKRDWSKGESFKVNTGILSCDCGMAFLATLCETSRDWLTLHKKFRVTVDYDPDGMTTVKFDPVCSA